jgi:hypothetical protein
MPGTSSMPDAWHEFDAWHERDAWHDSQYPSPVPKFSCALFQPLFAKSAPLQLLIVWTFFRRKLSASTTIATVSR